MDITQLILACTIAILTAILTVLGIEVFYILKDVRKLVERVNRVVGDAEEVVSNVKKPTEALSSITHSAELLSKLFEMVKHPDGKQTIVFDDLKKDPIVSAEDQDQSEQMPSHLSMPRRFFRLRRPS